MSEWKWMACGKHPFASDFLQIGQETALGCSLCQWMQSGYEKVLAKQGSSVNVHSWRFWARGGARKELILGLVRDSSDSWGRRFPFLVFGSGDLKDWINAWQYLPLTCDTVWLTMEQLTVARLSKVTELEQQLKAIRPPRGSVLEKDRQKNDAQNIQQPSQAIGRIEPILLNQKVNSDSMLAFRIAADADEGHAMLPIVNVHHQLQTDWKTGVPQIVFMGGTSVSMLVLCFFRSLTASDFMWMWSIDNQENRQDGCAQSGPEAY